MKRLCIYFFYDKDGIVDRYVLKMLSAMRPCVTQIAFVSNGDLKQNSKEKIHTIADVVIERENVGFDVWAYKTALEQYGWVSLDAFDEIIMMNHTIMGPLYPMHEVFSKMDSLDVDFWGLTTYHELSYDPMGKCKFGYIPLHLQSHFIAVRKQMFASDAFHKYWAKMPMINSYEEAVCFHEAIFTKTFADMGFRWKSYVDTMDLAENNVCPIIYSPVKILREKHCPVFKRRSFFHDYSDLCACSLANQGRDLMDYLQRETDFDTDLIWENVLRTCHFADVHRCLNLYHILQEDKFEVSKQDGRIALILHLYYEDNLEKYYQYALSMPPEADLYITTTSEEKKSRLEKLFGCGPWHYIEVRVVENRGRDVSALLVGCRDLASRYTLICFAHDKKSHANEMGIVGESFAEHCFANVLGSREYVSHIVTLFEQNPRLGLAFPPPPHHAGYRSVLGGEWSINFGNTKRLAESLDISVPMAENKEPIAPLGTVFWLRPAALAILFETEWCYDDFPPEPNGVDGTLLHAVERLYPFAAQQKGYYSTWITSKQVASRYILTVCCRLRDERREHRYGSLIRIIGFRLKRKVKEITPQPVWETIKKVYLKSGGRKWIG